MPLGLTNCGLCARYAGDWTDDGTDFVGKSGVFWPDFGTVSGPLAVPRFYAVLDRLGPTHGTLRRLTSVLGCCRGAARVWRCAPQTDAQKPGFDGAQSALVAKMVGWAADQGVYSELSGMTQPARTLGRGVARYVGDWRRWTP